MSTTAQPANPPVEILVVEDSPTQAQRLQHILEQQGYHVTATTNGRQALAAAQRHKPTLIISDVVMPEMDGYELCRRVKSDASLGGTPVILVTTLSDPQDVIRGLECLADNFILKPYDEHHLLSRVQFVLVNRDLRQAEQAGMGVEIYFNGHKHFITADRLQILNLLLSTYEAAIHRNKELSVARDDLHKLNAKLEAANQELDAFASSVAHDLHAPARHVAAYARILLEECSAGMNPTAQEHLLTIAKAGERMGRLITDLLAFARLSRAELLRTPVNLGALVAQVRRELKPEMKDRTITWKISELPTVEADESMLKQVFFNLLSNAIKYTRTKPSAEIEIGSQDTTAGEQVFLVRDNGVGFDMEYAPKLFGVFQRLHPASEFEGTGLGLSIVQRIVQRHGGRAWAEGKVGEGATFYFTLPTKESNHEN
ncbi:MAG: response regulator [Verrucomicrobia bacterium]|nr:response regulator [Verrucomicrobiota bacterium]